MYFVFLEFLDPIVEETLRGLRDSLQPWKNSKSPVHVTVRGPYRRKPDERRLREFALRLRGQGVRIIGAGCFSHGDSFSVFLRAESEVFKEIWWKPDYRTPRSEIQPHITIFESTDPHFSMLVLNFLKAAKISINAKSIRLSVYSSTEPELFGSRPVGVSESNFEFGNDIVAVDDDVLPRAREIGVYLMENGAK